MKNKTMKNKTIKNNNQQGYGLLSMMAMIVGIVISSGIFVKNAGLIGITGDITDVIWTWAIGCLVVIMIVIAFIEIISITEITGQQATLTNWGRNLLGVRFGKFIGYYMTFMYFPVILAALFTFSSKQLLDTLSISGWLDISSMSSVNNTILIFIIAFFIMLLICLINSVTIKPGKYFQNIGTCIKTVPLFFVILLFFFIIVTNIEDIDFSKNVVDVQDPLYDGISHFPLILMTLPSIFFTFDGFLLAGSMSKEGKTKTTFKLAFIFSMIFIMIIYVLFSIATLGLGDPEINDIVKYGTINNVIYTVFELGVAQVIAPIISLIIIISISTGASGCFISSTRMLSDMSTNNSVVDIKHSLISKNKYGVSKSSGFRIMWMVFFWLCLSSSLDTIVASQTGDLMIITFFMSDFIVMGAFLIYGLIIFGGLINRFRSKEKQVKTNKNILFIPACIIAIIGIFGTTIYFAFTILTPFGVIMGADWDKDEWTKYWFKLEFAFIFIAYLFAITIYNIIKTENMSNVQISKKSKQSSIYYGDTIIVKDEKLSLKRKKKICYSKRKKTKK